VRGLPVGATLVPADDVTGRACMTGADAGAAGHAAAHLAKGTSRPDDTLWRADPRQQGLLGVTDAIAWFGAAGYVVSVPLLDTQPYDLVVDGPRGLERIQVKTTTYRSPRGVFVASIATRGGNRSFHTVKYFDPDSCDAVYVLTDAGDRYLVPTVEISSRSVLHLGRKVARFRLERRKGCCASEV
jgi:hypothetical protein